MADRLVTQEGRGANRSEPRKRPVDGGALAVYREGAQGLSGASRVRRTWLPFCLLAAAGALPSAAIARSLSDGVLFEGAPLLKAPDGAPAIPVAAEAPQVYVRSFSGLPDGGKGTLWSSWGDGRLASNGKYYLAIGNHLDLKAGRGESRVYEFDPATKALRLAVNVRETIPDPKLAGGKIHSRIEEAADGCLYFATYWGKVPKDPDWEAGFRGSVLLRFDPTTGKVESSSIFTPCIAVTLLYMTLRCAASGIAAAARSNPGAARLCSLWPGMCTVVPQKGALLDTIPRRARSP